MIDQNGSPLCNRDIEVQLEVSHRIIHSHLKRIHQKSQINIPRNGIGIFTSESRPEWAKLRQELESHSEVNRQTLKAIVSLGRSNSRMKVSLLWYWTIDRPKELML